MEKTTSVSRKTIAKNLQFWMYKRGITQEDIMQKLGVSASTIYNWTTGNKCPRINHIEALANYLNVKITDLIGEGIYISDNLTEVEGDLISKYRLLPEDVQQAIIILVDNIIEKVL